jgi:hypothetical protein
MKLFLLHLILLTAFSTKAQTSKINTVQPKIMVVPYTREGEDVRQTLESDDKKILAITKIKEHFDMRGFTTVDFVAKLKIAREGQMVASKSQKDLKTLLIESSGADIYVDAKIDYQPSASGNSVNLVLTAYEISTGNSLSNKVGFSGKFFTDQIDKLTSRAVENCIEEFLNIMQEKFTYIVNNGRSIQLNISIENESKINFASPFKGLPLSDLIEQWVELNSFKNDYHIQGTSDLIMIFDDIKIPLRDPITSLNYSPNKFALALFKFFSDIGLKVEKASKSGNLYFTIK